jgi:hypothetical protein
MKKETVASLQSLPYALEPSPFGFGTQSGTSGKMIVGKMISQDRIQVVIILPSIILPGFLVLCTESDHSQSKGLCDDATVTEETRFSAVLFSGYAHNSVA